MDVGEVEGPWGVASGLPARLSINLSNLATPYHCTAECCFNHSGVPRTHIKEHPPSTSRTITTQRPPAVPTTCIAHTVEMCAIISQAICLVNRLSHHTLAGIGSRTPKHHSVLSTRKAQRRVKIRTAAKKRNDSRMY